jgi:DNA-binding IclR family transcriptional regulator
VVSKVKGVLDYEGMSMAEIHETTGLDKKVIREALLTLRSSGHVISTGDRATMRYLLNRPDEEN